MATRRAQSDTETTDEDAPAVEVSKAREKFNNGEITWRELCEAEQAE